MRTINAHGYEGGSVVNLTQYPQPLFGVPGQGSAAFVVPSDGVVSFAAELPAFVPGRVVIVNDHILAEDAAKRRLDVFSLRHLRNVKRLCEVLRNDWSMGTYAWQTARDLGRVVAPTTGLAK